MEPADRREPDERRSRTSSTTRSQPPPRAAPLFHSSRVTAQRRNFVSSSAATARLRLTTCGHSESHLRLSLRRIPCRSTFDSSDLDLRTRGARSGHSLEGPRRAQRRAASAAIQDVLLRPRAVASQEAPPAHRRKRQRRYPRPTRKVRYWLYPRGIRIRRRRRVRLGVADSTHAARRKPSHSSRPQARTWRGARSGIAAAFGGSHRDRRFLGASVSFPYHRHDHRLPGPSSSDSPPLHPGAP